MLKLKSEHYDLARAVVAYARLDVANSNSVVAHTRHRHSHHHHSLVTQLGNLCEMKENDVGKFQSEAKEITARYWVTNGSCISIL